MERCGESNEYFKIEWHLENFHFSWHKTGERLESPLFNVNIPCKTSWRLWLYPRGEDDGEYISCYLFRAEGGPEFVDVDFDLYLFIKDKLVKPKVSFSKIYSFKSCQREGLKCFVSRWEVFAPLAAQKDNFTLIFGCQIFNPNIQFCEQIMLTRVEVESVSGTEIFDCDTEFDSETNNAIRIKPVLKDEPLIIINLSYTKENLVMEICPVSCTEIQYGTIKISVIKNWGKKSPIEHNRSWIGEIKPDTWRYQLPRPDEELAKPDVEIFTHKAFLLRYNFTFSLGVVVEKIGIREYVSHMKTWEPFMELRLHSDIKTLETARSVLGALGDVYRSRSYFDINIQTKTNTFPAHKAIICSRSSELQSSVKKESEGLLFPFFKENITEEFFQFLYTDTVEFLSWKVAFELYQLACIFDVQLLKTKSRSFLMDNLDHGNASLILHMSRLRQDLPMNDFVENYIMSHYDLVLSSAKWQILAESDRNLPKELILLKYRKKKCN